MYRYLQKHFCPSGPFQSKTINVKSLSESSTLGRLWDFVSQLFCKKLTICFGSRQTEIQDFAQARARSSESVSAISCFLRYTLFSCWGVESRKMRESTYTLDAWRYKLCSGAGWSELHFWCQTMYFMSGARSDSFLCESFSYILKAFLMRKEIDIKARQVQVQVDFTRDWQYKMSPAKLWHWVLRIFNSWPFLEFWCLYEWLRLKACHKFYQRGFRLWVLLAVTLLRHGNLNAKACCADRKSSRGNFPGHTSDFDAGLHVCHQRVLGG